MNKIIILLVLLVGCNGVYDIPEKEWRQYRAMEGKELMVLWVQSFFHLDYSMPDKDCSGTFRPFINGFGAKLERKTAWQYREDLQKNGYRRNKFDDVEVTDIVCFNLNKNKIGHIGIIVKIDKKSKKLYIVEHSEQSNGYNYRGLRFIDGRINSIYMVTPSFFYGNSIKK